MFLPAGSNLIKDSAFRVEEEDRQVSRHVVVRPCPECFAGRSVRTKRDLAEETWYCPHCGHIWVVEVPRNEQHPE